MLYISIDIFVVGTIFNIVNCLFLAFQLEIGETAIPYLFHIIALISSGRPLGNENGCYLIQCTIFQHQPKQSLMKYLTVAFGAYQKSTRLSYFVI